LEREKESKGNGYATPRAGDFAWKEKKRARVMDTQLPVPETLPGKNFLAMTFNCCRDMILFKVAR
jgi:hypothetical protein